MLRGACKKTFKDLKKKKKCSQLYKNTEFSLKYWKRNTSSEEDVIQAGSEHMKCLLKKMSFGVTTDDTAGRIITKFGGLFSCHCNRINVQRSTRTTKDCGNLHHTG